MESFYGEIIQLNPNEVRLHHFKKGKYYDNTLTDEWEVQKWRAKREYNRWLRKMRKIPGNELFRRKLEEVFILRRVNYNNNLVIKKQFVYKDGSFKRKYRETSIDIMDEDGTPYTRKVYVPIENDFFGINNNLPSTQISHVINNSSSSLSDNVLRKRTSNTNPMSNRLLPQSRIRGVKPDDENFRAKFFTEKMGRDIRNLRNSLQLTQADLAKKINVSTNVIKNIEHGGLITFHPEDLMVKSLAKALGVTSIKYQE